LSSDEEDGVPKRTGLLTRGLIGWIKAEVAVICAKKQASTEVCTKDLIFKIKFIRIAFPILLDAFEETLSAMVCVDVPLFFDDRRRIRSNSMLACSFCSSLITVPTDAPRVRKRTNNHP